MTLNNKVVWITGATSGIGEELVYKIAKEGAKIVISARRESELERVKKASNLNDDSIFIAPLDLAQPENFEAVTNSIIKKFGRIDLLINNAGISQRSLLMETQLSVTKQLMEINFFGTVALTKTVMPHMIKNKSGKIVVISSVAGKFGFYWRSAYSASKFALHGYFEALRLELYNDNIEVLMVCPGKINTNVSLNAVDGNGNKYNQLDPGTQNGMAADVCASKIVKAMKANKHEVYIGFGETFAVYLKRFAPAKLFFNFIRKASPN